MAYIAPIHRPSSVRHAIKLNLLSNDEESLVVAKSNRLELYLQSDDGLVLHHSQAVYGKVTMLNRLRPANEPTEHLFVGTDRYYYFTMAWSPEEKQLKTVKTYQDLADKAARDSQTGDRSLLDPTGKFMTLELYEGIITVVPLTEKGKRKGDPEISVLGEPVPSRIEEMFVRSSAFLHRKSPETEKPLLALLYEEDEDSKIRLRLRQLGFQSAGADEQAIAALDTVEGLKEDLDLGASHLIPVPAPCYGVLVLGETSITYFNDYTKALVKKPLDESTIFVSWEQIDNQRFLLADDFGGLYLFMLLLDEGSGAVEGWRLDRIGETSRASALVYLDAGHVFVGSHEGDSQVIRITEGSTEVVQTFHNIAPILDFTIMDMGNRSGEGQSNEYSSGQARIVTGSGAFKDGSLRSVRSGVGLEDQGALGEIGSISNLFALSSTASEDFDDTLLVSLINESRVFCFDADGQVEEVEDFKGLQLAESTLLASNVPGGRLLQVTESAVRLTDLENGMVVSEWNAPAGQMITDVDSNDRFVILSIGGIRVIILSITDTIQVTAEKEYGAEDQLSCVAIPHTTDNICFVGFWQNCAVAILSLDGLETIETIRLSDDGSSVPRSLLLTQIFADQSPTLFIATADGNVVTFAMDPSTFALSGRKSTVLGTQQANFKALPRGNGLYNVFATCEHPSLIYGSEGRLVYSAVTAEKATCVCPFNAEAYPRSIAIAASGELHLAVVDEERRTHVQTLHVNETVRRIAYSPHLKAFGLGTIKRVLRDREEVVQGHFRLADEVVFKELHSFEMNEYEIVECAIRAELDDGDGGVAERFIVGTSNLIDEEDSGSTRGRILVFEVTEDRQLKVIAEMSTKGACRCLAMIDGKIVAGLIKTVVVYSFEYPTASTPLLVKKASYRTSTAPIDITVTGNQIAVADLIKSVSVLEYRPSAGEQNDELKEVARHVQVSWSTALAEVNENTYLQADAEGNLILLERDVSGVTEEDRKRLMLRGDMLLGEQVNRIRRIDMATASDAPVIPRAFFATVEGSIYLFALITPSKVDLLIRLQSQLAEFVKSPGNYPFLRYRAFKTQVREEEEPNRFVDGDLIERFLDLKPQEQEELVKGVYAEIDVEEVRALVETLRRLH
ncbi:DNA damage-binding protein 1 [Lasiodiplodia hormozganensis]|uniref:DNA damage-binding protein 1 n=2 Tax=Lasiodiplodia TaxID=66739 RepID=A0A5N5DMX0_9PEZI|nr:DNA damage-binding protein 1 [Lasiodiplodia theobromae]KAK0661768.1 DNA damage-binding protein 1 [Lasiodiplodia hormozganensis]